MRVPKIIRIMTGLIKLLQKQNGAIFVSRCMFSHIEKKQNAKPPPGCGDSQTKYSKRTRKVNLRHYLQGSRPLSR